MARKSLIALLAIGVLATASGCSGFYDADPCAFGSPRAPAAAEANAVSIIFQASEDFPDARSAISQDSRLRGFFPESPEEQPFSYSVIAADGAPNILFQSWVQMLSGDRQQDLEYKSDRAISGLGNIYECAFTSTDFNSGFEDNVSLLVALDLAAKSTSKASGEQKIFVYSNGLQTAGQPNFSEFFPSSSEEISSTVERLAAENALPDLRGLVVYWSGIGQVTTSRDPLSQQTINLLKTFWREVIIASGGVLPEGFDAGKFGSTPPENAAESLTLAKIREICFSATIDESQGFEFTPDTASFVDSALASVGAKYIAQSIQNSDCGDARIRVTGFTASGANRDDFQEGNDVDNRLSEARAQAFADLLIQEGVSVSEVVGGGKGVVDDWNTDGSFSAELGKLNRVVKIEEIQ
jgi:outer membrane protein OmpA-like peptidoglycan-associated protein